MSVQPFRRITIAEHLAAKERLQAASEQFVMMDFGTGPTKVATGTVNLDDLTLRDGHVCAVGFDGAMPDRFGWPEGHADSPARLLDPPELFNGIPMRQVDTLPESTPLPEVSWRQIGSARRLSFWARLRVRFEAAREAWDDAL